eukprot:TRINITY_DN2708_c0_g1_i1.p2 TRINITY_DN2708_c0_g1~~TRINITY_DN2708_c0_g1_i1.p2  ORF type:complete len:107 (-),score=26.55 TRINITY_DN2708_c0_g1_i1:25-345(-)
MFMNLFMLWMAGNSVQIFSIMITVMAIFSPVKAIFGISSAFARFEGAKVDLRLPKLAYLGLNCVAAGAGLWKLAALGLLPTSSDDWQSWAVSSTEAGEVAVGGPAW